MVLILSYIIFSENKIGNHLFLILVIHQHS